MDAKEYLSQTWLAKREIVALKDRRRRCGELLRWRSPGGPGEAEALQAELDERIDAYAALVRRVEAAIDRVEDPLQRAVLGLRYLNGWSWKAIAAQTGYTRSWLMRQHALALKAFEGAIGAGESDFVETGAKIMR